MELFCGSGNLTFAMKHFFPDSFGVDHKVGKQRVKIICLDLTKEDHQQLVMQWAASELCLWVHFGVPCGTASMARYKRLSKRVHGPPPLRSLRWPDGLPTVKGTNLLRLRAANRLYSFMAKLILQLEASKITWTVENPWTSLLWKTSYWRLVTSEVAPFYAEVHNCMFGGLRLKRTCIASNNEAVMALNILCDGNHDHAPWSMENGIFDTAREAEYTPALSKALATVVLESLAGEHKLPNIAQKAKRLKLSHFQAIASGKQPTKALSISTVPDFAFVLVLSNLPEDIQLPLANDVVTCCTIFKCHGSQFLLPCGCKLLRRTKKGGDVRPFKYSLEHTPSLNVLSDVPVEGKTQPFTTQNASGIGCERCDGETCQERLVFDLTTLHGDAGCVDWVLGVRWSPEAFIEQALAAGHPFKNFSGLSTEVRSACEYIAMTPHDQVVTERCQ